MADSPKSLTDKQHAFVAAYLGIAGLNATEAARIAGYKGTRKTLGEIGAENLEKPKIQAAIDAWRAEVKQEGIANLEHRIAVINELEARSLQVIVARQQRYAARLVARDSAGESTLRVFGGDIPEEAATGLLVEKETITAAGLRSVEWQVDTGLVKQVQSLHEQAAKEMGQRETRIGVQHSGRVDHVHRVAAHQNLSVEQLERLEAVAIEVLEQEHAV